MKKRFLSLCLLLFWLCGAGCRSNLNKSIVVGNPVDNPPSLILTLPWYQLDLLDLHSPNHADTRVKDKRIFLLSGVVQFEIYFPSNNPGSQSLNFVSSGEGGKGTLVGANIRDYDEFVLKFTLVSINGQREPEMKQKLVVGALIGPTNDGKLSTFEPVTLGMAASEKTTIAKTPLSTDEIYQIGFHVHMLNPQDWDKSGSIVKLEVEPVKDGVAVPQSH